MVGEGLSCSEVLFGWPSCLLDDFGVRKTASGHRASCHETQIWCSSVQCSTNFASRFALGSIHCQVSVGQLLLFAAELRIAGYHLCS